MSAQPKPHWSDKLLNILWATVVFSIAISVAMWLLAWSIETSVNAMKIIARAMGLL